MNSLSLAACSLLFVAIGAASTLQVQAIPASGEIYFSNLPSDGSATASTVLTANQTISGNGGYTDRGYTGSYSSYLSFGHLGLSESLAFSCTGACGNEQYVVELSASALDNLTFNSVSVGQQLRIQYLFEGSLTDTAPVQSYLDVAEAYLYIDVGSSSGGGYGASLGQGTNGVPVGFNVIGGTFKPDPTTANTWNYYVTGYYFIPITSTRLFGFGESVFGDVACSDVYGGASCNDSMNFLNTGLIGGAVVVDASGNPVTGASFSSDSGYDYSQPLPTPTPEPSNVASMTIGFGTFAILCLRMRRLQP